MQSTAISITSQSQSMVQKRPAPKGPKLIQGYTPLIGPEAWLSTMSKKRMSSASTSVFYPLPHPHIRLLPSSTWFLLLCRIHFPWLSKTKWIVFSD